MAKAYYKEIYLDRSCMVFMDKNPLVVEVGIPLEEVAILIAGRGDKVARVQGSLVPVMSNGSFYVPRGALWLPAAKAELSQFPQGYLDTADALSLAFAEAMGTAMQSPPPPGPGTALKDPRIITAADLFKSEPEEKGKPSPWKKP